MERDQLITVIAFIVAFVWGITALASLLIRDYTGLSIVTTVMLPVVGALLGFKRPGGDK